MLELIAQGTQPDFRWRRPIPTESVFQLGRTTPSFRVPWDDRVSRCHTRMQLQSGKLLVQKLEEAGNPVFYNGNAEESFTLFPGEHFVIGNTTFTFAQEQAYATLDVPNPISQKSFSTEFLHNLSYHDADHRIDVLNRLPDVISSAGDEQDLLNRMVNTLLAGISTASTIGVVRHQPTDTGPPPQSDTSGTDPQSDLEVDVIHWDRRGELAGNFQPSEKLIRQSLSSSETLLHIWQPSRTGKPEFTFDFENDWAFVCPIDSPATSGWGIYVTGSNRPPSGGGSGSGEIDLQGDIKFCELVGSTLKNLLQVKQLERRQAGFRGFFSPFVLEAMAGRDADEVLAPKECQVSVMFCDLRGFSKTSESMADELFSLLQRVSSSLDVMTGKILKNGGVIGDFHGDSAMGFWGWPLTQEDIALRAINAAVDIHAEFNKRQLQRTDFQIGIGIATGMAVAGKIGTRDQVKVTVFGPVVNLASRLEGMTRSFESSILIDQATWDQLSTIPSDHSFHARQLGRIQPYGMTTAIDVLQLLVNDIEPATTKIFEKAVDAFQAGEWEKAKLLLTELPSADTTRLFFEDYMQRESDSTSQLIPPPNWQGVIEMKSK